MKKTVAVLVGIVIGGLLGTFISETVGVTVTSVSSESTPKLVDEINTALGELDTAVDSIEAGTVNAQSSLSLSNSANAGAVSIVLTADKGDNAEDKAKLAVADGGTLSFYGYDYTNEVLYCDVNGNVGIDGDLTVAGADVNGANSDSINIGTTDATFVYTRNNSGDVTFKGADDTGAANTIYDTTLAGTITVGSADVTSITLSSDGTGTAEVVLPAGSIDGTEILDATIANADISTTAGIAFSKLAALEPGYLIVGNTQSNAAAVAVSGDLTLVTNGAFSAVGLTTNIDVIVAGSTTNRLVFTNGLLKAVSTP